MHPNQFPAGFGVNLGKETVSAKVAWAYRCPEGTCPGAKEAFKSCKAEAVPLKDRRFSRELVVRGGYQPFWQHQTMDEIHAWLTNDLRLNISVREGAYVFVAFLALLRAAQPARLRNKLGGLRWLIISSDGMQPEKGHDCRYIVRENQCGVRLLAVNPEESSQDALCKEVLEPLKALAQALGFPWHGVVSDAQETICLAVAQSLKDVPHQACQSHCLRAAGKLTFEADRTMKKELKASFRHALPRLRKRIQALPDSAPFRPVRLDYTAAIRSVLPEGGVAPFELGGIKVYDALQDLEASVLRCQKKGRTSCYAV
jgi:hypothetical protein